MKSKSKDTKSLPQAWTIAPPVMSWDRPIEEIILEYVQSMKRSWRTLSVTSIHGNVRKDARSFIIAYESVEDYIRREMKLRADIATSRQDTKKKVNSEAYNRAGISKEGDTDE